MTILDRYVLTKFLVPFAYCLVGFVAIWFIFDLADNLPDFLQGKANFNLLLQYYLSQIPQIIVMSIPTGMMLALLYSLTAMSRKNEIISMLGAGLSVERVLLPLFGAGIVLSLVTFYFNSEGAPHAEATKKQMLRDIKRGDGDKKIKYLSGHLFRNREDNRTWFVRKFLPGQNEMQDVQIIQQDADYNITDIYYAPGMIYNPQTKEWTFKYAKRVKYRMDGSISDSQSIWDWKVGDWSETPWRISSSVMNPDFLSIHELRDYLDHNSDFPHARLAPYRTHLQYRYALPAMCLVVVLLAAPMGIVYSRRGVLAGVMTAIGLFFSLVFVSSLFIAFGKGDRISPWIAAWGPVIVYFGIGLILLWFRSTNRDIPKPKIPWLN